MAFMLAVSLHLVLLQALPGFHFAEARIPPAVQDISVHLFSNAPAVPEATQPANRAREKNPARAAGTEPLPTPVPMPMAASESAAATTTAAIAPDAETVSAASTPATAPAPITAAHIDTRYLDNPAPAYPPLSRRLGETGQVMLRVQVSATGSVLDIAIEQSSGYPRLDAAARAAVLKWRFVPARQGDETIESHVRVPMRFGLES